MQGIAYIMHYYSLFVNKFVFILFKKLKASTYLQSIGKNLFFLGVVLLMISTQSVFSQNFTCSNAWQICTAADILYPGSEDAPDAESGPDYGCLYSQHNPAWFYMQIDVVGDITLNISNPESEDIDFICWGPFSSKNNVCNELTSDKEVDCSFSFTSDEDCEITDANMNIGDYYILLVTNYSTDPCAISISKTGGTGETVCPDLEINPSSNSPICSNNDIELYSNISNALSYVWIGPNDFISFDANPPPIENATSENAGVYTLHVVTSTGSSLPTPTLVEVLGAGTADFTVSPACSGLATQFTDNSTSSGSLSWEWDFGDGSAFSNAQNPTHFYQNSGTYDVQLTIDNGACVSSITQSVEIIDPPQVSFTHEFINGNACAGSEIQFNIDNPNEDYSYTWNFAGQGASSSTNPSFTFNSGNDYPVNLSATYNGCSNEHTEIISVNSNPDIDFSFTEVCEANVTSFYSIITAASPYSVVYNFGDGNTSTEENPNHLYSSANTYSVTLNVEDVYGCENSVSHEVDVYHIPVADFENTVVCQGELTYFTDLSTCDNPPISQISSWLWNFGDGSANSNEQNPSHQYPGDENTTYSASLTVTTVANCSNTASKEIILYANPLASFSYDLEDDFACEDHSVQFLNESSGSYTSSSWDFGDGSTSSLNNPIHTYTDPGIYNISLTVYTSDGCQDTYQDQLEIIETPVVDFSFSNVCLGTAMEFNDSEFINVGNTSFWEYDFDDGSTSNVSNPTHNFTTPGVYNVSLSITNNQGCSNSISHQVEVYDNPVADFTFDTVCQNNVTNFVNLSEPFQEINEWFWDFGDGNTSTESDPVHLYDTAGTYNVILNIQDNHQCSETINKSIWVKHNPITDFSFNTTSNGFCQNDAVQFNDLSETYEGEIIEWQWNFGDGNTSDQESPLHSYLSNGNFQIHLTTMNSVGCESSNQQEISIYEEPSIDFSFTEVCFGAMSEFFDSPFVDPGSITEWHYDFDDGNSSNESDPSHLYSNAGVYDVHFSIVDTNGCTNSISHSVSVFESPVAEFSYDTVCLYSSTQFTDLSEPSSGIDFWQWDLGDGQTSELQNLNYIYENPGSYNVKLVAGNTSGCSDTIFHTVRVWEPPVANFVYSDTSCTEGLLYFNDSSYSNESEINDLLWYFPDGHMSFDPNTYFIFLNSEVFYNVSLYVEDMRGCSDTLTEHIYIEPELRMSFTADTVCFGNETTLRSFFIKPEEDSILRYTWSFMDNSPQITTQKDSIKHVFTESGNFEVMMQATNADGCTSTSRKNIKVRANPVADYSFTNSYCNDSSWFIDQSIEAEGNITYWKWEFGDGDSLEIFHPESPDIYHFYTPLYNEYQSRLSIMDEFGCIDNKEYINTHYPCVFVNYLLDTTWVCSNTKAVFIDSTIVDSDYEITSKTWFFGNGDYMIVDADTDTVYYQYEEDGFYHTKLMVEYQLDELLVRDSSELDIEILPSPRALFNVEEVCLGETSVFQNLTQSVNNEIRNISWDFGDGQDTLYPYTAGQNEFRHEYSYDSTYKIQLWVMAKNNCKDSIVRNHQVHPIPNIGFSADSNIFCGNAQVVFRDTSTINSGYIASRFWIFGDGDYYNSESDSAAHYYSDGTYSVSLENTSDKFCTNSLTIDDYILINPVVESGFDLEPLEISISNKSQLKIHNYVNDISSLRWSLSDTIHWEKLYVPNIADSIHDTGTYHLKQYTMNEYGCQDSVSVKFVITPAYSFYIPDAFSPNNNGVNDTWGPVGKYFDMRTYDLRIFSRWGELIFETQDFYQHWDGSLPDGSAAPIGSYAYIIRLQDMEGNYKLMKGSIVLLL